MLTFRFPFHRWPACINALRVYVWAVIVSAAMRVCVCERQFFVFCLCVCCFCYSRTFYESIRYSNSVRSSMIESMAVRLFRFGLSWHHTHKATTTATAKNDLPERACIRCGWFKCLSIEKFRVLSNNSQKVFSSAHTTPLSDNNDIIELDISAGTVSGGKSKFGDCIGSINVCDRNRLVIISSLAEKKCSVRWRVVYYV